jgi:hypothetical protein
VRTPGTFSSHHFIHRTQGWDAGRHYDNVRLDAGRRGWNISLCIMMYMEW